MNYRNLLPLLFAAGAVVAGCQPKTATPLQPAVATTSVSFKDVAQDAGITFIHNTGASGKYWMPESMGSGCAWIDYNSDGFPDLYLVNGTDWPGQGSRKTTGALYRNNRDGTFTDVTQEAGLAQSFYGMGAAVGDFDNDGHPDLYVTALGENRLYRNNGDGTFTEIGKQAGVADPHWSASAAWIDYDNDGLLDLFVTNYVKWSPEDDVVCKIRDEKTYCTPEVYEGVPNALYKNLGNGRFRNVAAEAGVDRAGKSLGVAICDFNEDGLMDIAVANDTVQNFLYKNLGNGKFQDVAVEAGVDRGPDGKARGAMGIDAADFEGTGRDSLVIGNFSNESLTVYQNEGAEFFRDVAPQSGVAQASKVFLTFGTLLVDFDNNGWPDIFAATGHVKPQIQLVEEAVTYAQRLLVFSNAGESSFAEVGLQLGPDVSKPRVARGLAAADFDGDGDLDLVLTVNGGPAVLLRNDGEKGNSVRVKLVGTKSNRSGYGAKLTATVNGREIPFTCRSGMSYCSQSDSVAHFGIGAAAKLEKLVVRWPSGQVDEFTDVPAGKLLTLTEGQGELQTASR
jgi:enediyne biosynthesis protein E4